MALPAPPLSSTPSAPQPRARRRDAERNRERLVAAAAEVFAEQGISASLADVAERAGLGVGTVYRHMPDKQAVLVALLSPQLAAFEEELRACCREADAATALGEFLQHLATMMASSRAVSELLQATGDPLPEPLRAVVRRFLDGLSVLLARAQGQGTIRADLATSDLVLLLTTMSTVETAFARAPHQAQRLLGIYLDGIVTTRTAPTPLIAEPFPEALLTEWEGCGPGRA